MRNGSCFYNRYFLRTDKQRRAILRRNFVWFVYLFCFALVCEGWNDYIMGWVANGPESGDQFPVETMVNTLQATIRETDEACVVYNGQAKHCCDGIKSCFELLEDAFTVVRLQAIGNQNMHVACRSLKSELGATDSCVETWTGLCHWSVDQTDVVAPFRNNLDEMIEQRTEFCSNLPPEPTTVIATTTTTITTTTTTTLTTTKSQEFSKPMTSPTQTENTVTTSTSTTPKHTPEPSNPPFNSNPPTKTTLKPTTQTTGSSSSSTEQLPSSSTEFPGSGNYSGVFHDGRQNVTSLPEDDNTVIIVSSVVGGFIMVLLSIIVIIAIWRRYRQKNDHGSSNDSKSVSAFLWKWFQTSKDQQAGTNETEIYAEIDDAFMEAVYGIDRDNKKKPRVRDRVASTSQMNMCYESPDNDKIIAGSNKQNDTGFSPTRKNGNFYFGSSNQNEPRSSPTRKSVKDESPTHKGVKSVSPTHKSVIGDSPTHKSGRPSRLDFIRKEDDMVTSFKIEQSKPWCESDRKMSNQTQIDIVVSRPSFTAIRGSPVVARRGDTEEYVSNDETPYTTPEEPIYAVPDNEYEYDSVNYGRNVLTKITQAQIENDYASLTKITKKHNTSEVDNSGRQISEYTNVDASVPDYVAEYRNADVPEYMTACDYMNTDVPEYVKASEVKKNKKSDKKKDKGKKTTEDEYNVYENVDTMMVY